MTKTFAPYRLALRVEGDDWVAYLAEIGTMERARRLFSIPMAFVVSNEARKEEFITLARNVVTDIAEATGDEIVGWDVRKAPENERAGRA